MPGIRRKTKERDGLVVLGWSLLSNHYHLAVRSGPVPLSRSLRSIQGRFSQAFNIRHGRSGPVWQGRYQARLVGEAEYLRQLIIYVHLNPVRAGLAEDPARYPWCGHLEMIGRRKQTLLDVDDALLVFGQTRRSARREYLAALRAALAQGGHEAVLLDAPWWSREAELRVRRDVAYVDELGRSTAPTRPAIEAEEFLRLCCEQLEMPLSEIRSRKRGSTLTRARELVAALALQRWGQSTSALAALLGMYPDSLGRQATRAAQRAVEEPDFHTQLNELDSQLMRRTEGRE
jgi:REP element-mobilizing transposase RayT